MWWGTALSSSLCAGMGNGGMENGEWNMKNGINFQVCTRTENLQHFNSWKSELKFYSNNYVESTTDIIIFLPLIAYLGTKIQGREGDPLIK